MQTIKVKDRKIAASIELENGDVYKVTSPNFDQLQEFQSMKNSENENALFEAFEKLGLPTKIGKQLPISVLNDIAESLLGGNGQKK